MKSIILLATVIVLSNASTLQIKTLPSSITVPENVEDFELASVSKLNNFMLGLSADIDEIFNDVTGDLFSRPKALAVVQVKNVDAIDGKTSREYKSTDESEFDFSATEKMIKSTFGNKGHFDELKNGVHSGQLSSKIQSFDVSEDSVKTKIPQLRDELLSLQKMIGYLKKNGPRLGLSAPELFNIEIDGFVNAIGTKDEINAAKKELGKILDELVDVLKSTYGDQVVVEVITTDGNVESSGSHLIAKRDTQSNQPLTIQEIRKKYNVYSFTQGDYPAIFAIFAGVSIILSIAILFIAVGMWTMDPGKDSIIYRMTTTKLKKD